MEGNELKLLEWQPAGIEHLRTHPGCILGDEQGLGKTVQFICAAKNFNGPVLFICRPLAKPFIVEEIKKWDPGATIVRCVEGGLFNEKVVKEWFGMPRKRGYLIVHHEAVRIIADRLRALGTWEIVCVDEAHRLSNSRTQISKAIKSLSAFYKWAMSGTIMDRSPADFWNLLNWFQPHRFRSYWTFHEQYVDTIRNAHGQVVKQKPKNLPKFQQEVGPFYFRRTAADVGIEEPLYVDVPLEMFPRQKEVYDKLAKGVAVQLERESSDDPLFISNALQRMHLLRMAAIHPTLVDVVGKGVKYEWVEDWLEDYPDESVVIFTHSKNACADLGGRLTCATYITGDVENSEREKRLAMWQEGKFKVLVLVTDLAAESLNLQKSWNAVFLDIHPSSRMMSQAEMRVRRANSTHRARVYRLICKDTVDVLFAKRLQGKLNDRELVDEFLRRYHASK